MRLPLVWLAMAISLPGRRFASDAMTRRLRSTATRKQISETDCLASSAVARSKLVRVVLLPKKTPVVRGGKGAEKRKSERRCQSANGWR